MTQPRTWKIQINLDEFNALCGAAFTEAERSALLGGLQLGCNNGTLPEHCSNTVRTAFDTALGWRRETEEFRLKQSGAGKASAEARKVKFGSANPNAVRTDLEHSPNLTNNQQPSKPKPKNPSKPKNPPPPEEYIEGLKTICKDWPRKTTYGDAVKNVDVLVRPEDLWARFKKFEPNEDPQLLINCAFAYLDDLDTQEKDFRGLIPYVCAMTNFFGEKALWKREIVKVQK